MGVCESCWNKKAFGEKCWFYWEGKKTCSQFKKSPDSEPEFASEETFLKN